MYKKRHLVALLIPSIVLIAVFIIIPILLMFVLSFYRFSLIEPIKNNFIGLENYSRLILDERFWNSLKVASILGFSTVAFQLIFGITIAILLNSDTPGAKSTRALFILPMTIPPIVGSVMWKLLFDPNIPGINYMLSLLGIKGPIWFQTPLLALTPIIIVNVWEFTPFVILILLAALEALPKEPFESARIDGANSWQEFFKIKLPLLKGPIVFVIFFRMIDSLKIFPLIFVMTGGGPGTATESINYYAYNAVFTRNEIGYGATLIITMVFIVLIFLIFIIKSTIRE